MSLPKFKGIPKGIAWLSMVGLLSLMFAAPAVVTAAPAAAGDKVLVCKVVGGPGHYTLKEGKQPIEVDANALEADVQPIVGAPFSDAQPSFVVASDDRTLCEAGLPPVVVPNPNPAGSVSFVQPSCTVDHVVANITDATPPGVGPGYAGIWYYLVSSRGAESQTPDSVDRLSSFALNSQPMSFGETVTFTVKAQLDTPEGSPPLVVIDSFTATRPNASSCEESPVVVPVTAKAASVCTAGKYSYSFTNPNDVAVMVKSSGFDDSVRTETVIPAGGTATVTSTLNKLYYETYVSGVQVKGSATNISAGDLKCTTPTPTPTPTPTDTKVTPVVTPPTTPKVTTHKASPVAVPKVSTPVSTTSTATNPPVVTDYISNSPTKVVSAQVGSTGFGWYWLAAGFGAMLLIGSVLPRRKVQENKH